MPTKWPGERTGERHTKGYRLTQGIILLFSSPLRFGENAALSGKFLVPLSLRCGENKAFETDALWPPLSTALYLWNTVKTLF